MGCAYDSTDDACQNGERFAKGRLGRMTDSSGSTVYCYDRYGQLARKVQTTRGRSYALRYLHTDPRGRLPGQDTALQTPPPGNQLIGLTYPDGSSVRIVCHAQARPTELRVTLANGTSRVLLHGATHHPFGPVAQWTFGNGRTLRRTLDRNGRPAVVEDPAPGGISEDYRFDAAGNLIALRRADQADPAKRTYAYDGLDRLTHVRDGATTALLQQYAYDATGNRMRRSDAGIALDGTFVKIVSWYDNEWGYSTKCLEMVKVVAGR
ncbi:MAG: hypothetical protein ACOY82_18485 [Pseudomonadota bacterium]